jgi:hypothetical protein
MLPTPKFPRPALPTYISPTPPLKSEGRFAVIKLSGMGEHHAYRLLPAQLRDTTRQSYCMEARVNIKVYELA